MTSSKRNIFRVTGPLCVCVVVVAVVVVVVVVVVGGGGGGGGGGNAPVTGGFPSVRPVTLSLMFSLLSDWTYGWANNRYAGYLRRHRDHYDVTVIYYRNVFENVL